MEGGNLSRGVKWLPRCLQPDGSCTQCGSISPRIPFSNLMALSISQPTTISPRTTAPLCRVAKLLRACRVLCNRIWSRYLQRELRAVGPGFNVDCSTRIFGPHQVEIGANFYACRGLKITTFIDVESDCDCSAKLRIGTDVALNDYVTITAVDPIELEDGVLVGSRVYIGNSNHGIYKGSHHSPPDVLPNLRPLVGSGSITVGRKLLDWRGSNSPAWSPHRRRCNHRCRFRRH